MRYLKTLGILSATAAAVGLVAAPVSARPDHRHQKQVCKFERHHGKSVRVCHWVHR